MILQITDVSKKYDGINNVIENINLTINKGEYVYIIGPNGGGKTTLVKIITNIIKASSGTCEIRTNKIGYLPQAINARHDFPISVFEVIKTGLVNDVLPKKADLEAIIDEWLHKMAIFPLKKRVISSLSGGELQRVYFIRMIIAKPELLILDEPMSAIDPDFRIAMTGIINNYLKEMQATIIHVTHHLDENEKNRVFYIDKTIKEITNVCL